MIIAAIMNAVNIFVGYASIFGIGSIKGYGIYGAAAATIITQAVGCAIGLCLLYRRGGGLLSAASHDMRFFSLDRQEVRGIYATGIPAACEYLFWQFSVILLSRVILGYGSQYFAAYQLGLQAEILAMMPAAGFTLASTTLTAKAIGMGDGELFRSYYRSLIRMGIVVGAVTGVLLILLPGPIMGIMTDKAELARIGAVYLFIVGFSQLPQVLVQVYCGVIRASGGKRVPMYVTFIGIWGLRVPLSLIAAWVFNLDISFIWIIISMDLFIRMAICIIYFKVKRVIHCADKEEVRI